MFWGHTCLLYSEGAFYIPEVGPVSEVKLTGRYVPVGQSWVSVPPVFTPRPQCASKSHLWYQKYQNENDRAYPCSIILPFVKPKIDVRYTKCNLIATSMQSMELHKINKITGFSYGIKQSPATVGAYIEEYNKSSQWLPNTPFASISECLVS